MKIILSLSTVPERLNDPIEGNGLKPALKTIVEQTSSVPYIVRLNIPHLHKGVPVEIPEWLVEWQTTYPHLHVVRCEDYGPITKIYPTIIESEPDDIIITFDDDLFYCDGIIDAHLKAREQYPGCAIGFCGLDSIDPPGHHFVVSMPFDCRVLVLEGYKTVSYTRSFFDADLNAFIFSHWNDDVALGAYLGYKNIPKIVKAYEGEVDFTPRVQSFPVINHVPITSDVHACNTFRNDEKVRIGADKLANFWAAIGWLRR